LHVRFTLKITLKHEDKYFIKSITPQLEVTLESQHLGFG
jgi:hypothetical protein